jgi:mycinamicin biosynthesis methyltransferase MycE-like protein
MITTTEPAGEPANAWKSTEAVERLLTATAGREDVATAIDDIGAEETARVLIDELVFRARLGDVGFPAGTAVVVSLAHRERTLSFTISPRPGGADIHAGAADVGELPPPVISEELSEAAQALYGPRELVSAATRGVRWPGHDIVVPTPENPGPQPLYYVVVQRLLAVLDRLNPAGLTELAVWCGTDKWGALHQYTQHYERHFAPLRDHRLTILEIGIGGYHRPEQGGTSLHMWKHFFPRALIYGIDIVDKRPHDAARLTTVLADQSEPEQLLAVAGRHGPFDIVIDDGSHISEDVISTFRHLFPHLRSGGLYVIEDLHTAYWPELFHGSETDLDNACYTVGFLKTLIDGLHYEEFLSSEARDRQPTDTEIKGIHFYPNLAVIEKGPNAAGSPVADMLREVRRSGQ